MIPDSVRQLCDECFLSCDTWIFIIAFALNFFDVVRRVALDHVSHVRASLIELVMLGKRSGCKMGSIFR